MRGNWVIVAGGFNSSVGILLVHASTYSALARELTEVSIPQSEFFSFTHWLNAWKEVKAEGFNSSVGILLVHAAKTLHVPVLELSRFNSSVGILLVHAKDDGVMDDTVTTFQFLSRNSSRSRTDRLDGAPDKSDGFNSSVGILLVHACRVVQAGARDLSRFNSSVGILLVHAGCRSGISYTPSRFQFLSRNSSRSRYFDLTCSGKSLSVSIPQSEFFSFTRTLRPGCPRYALQFQFLSRNSSRSRGLRSRQVLLLSQVSIPQSEFFSFTRTKTSASLGETSCFNSSVGILLVHARGLRFCKTHGREFQFLSRNSSRSRC